MDELWNLVNQDQKNVTSCNSCFAEGTVENGEEQGDAAFEQCRDGDDGLDQPQCPEYARRACFSVETISEDWRPGVNPEISYRRGCSHFEVDDTQLRCNAYLDGTNYAEACKQTCTGEFLQLKTKN